MKFGLESSVAIVTGATGGIGQAIVQEFVEAGAAVVIGFGSQTDKAQELAAKMTALGGRVAVAQADVATASGAATLAQTAVEHFGRIDILVNNAGITRDGLLIRMKEPDWDAVVDTNLKSVYLCVQAAARQLLRSQCGRIINMASVAGLLGNVGQANYAAAKAGMIGLTKTLAREFASRKITANAIAPGFIETEMTAVLPIELRDKLLAQIPLQCFGQPEDVARVARFLASAEASYITGQTIQVDGGLVM